MARALGLTDNAVRAHLATLERDGMVRQAGSRRPTGAGKPATLYELQPDTETLLSRAGWQLRQITATNTADGLSVIEAVPA